MRLNISILYIGFLLLASLLSNKSEASISNDLTPYEMSWLKNKQKLIVGITDFDYPPYIIHSNEGKILGIYSDYLKLLSSTLGLTIEYKFIYSVSDIETMLKNGDVDIIPGFSKTERRAEFIKFSKPFMRIPRSILVNSTAKFAQSSDINQFKNSTFAVERSFATYHKLKQALPNAKFFEVTTTEEAISAVKFGLADAYLGDQILNNYILDKTQSKKIKIINIKGLAHDISRFAMPLDSDVLSSVLNKILPSIDQATHAYIRARWNKSNLAVKNGKIPLILTKSEISWLKSHKTIKYAAYNNLHPFSYNENDIQTGLSNELMKTIEEKLGVDFEPVVVNSWDDAVTKLNKNEIHLLPTLSHFQAKAYNLYSSSSYHTSPWVVLTKVDRQLSFDSIFTEKLTLADASGTLTNKEIKHKFPLATIINTYDMQENIDLITTGKADIFFSLLSSASPWLQGEHAGKFKIINNLTADQNVDIHFGSSDKNKVLLNIINKVLNEIGKNELEKINHKWSKINLNQANDLKKIIFYSLIIAAIVTVIIAAILY